ncbi:MAG: type II toxin-antitoxin system RatA family toxin [Burkholderiaceae bacterium]|jgi:ribosome-associated toxin RatA of RatAB toxin-antitoxin module
MAEIDKSVLVPYSNAQMFALVEAVEDYPKFLPWCAGTRVTHRTENAMDATIDIRYRGVEQSFTTHNTLFAHDRIQMEFRDGPFSELSGVWSFTPLKPGACKVQLKLHYAFSSRVLEGLVGPVFHYIATSFVDSFTRRAKALYG